MRGNMLKSLLIIGAIFLTVTVACGGTAQVVTPTPAPPQNTPTTAPTYTPYPTYTPVPLSTEPSNSASAPTDATTTQTSPADGSLTKPINCAASKTTGYNTCIDDTGNIQADVPDYWTEVNGGTWTYDGKEIGVAISAAPSLTNFQNYFDAEGMFFGASGTFAQIYGHVELLDFYTMPYRENCKYIGRFDYDDGVYRGKYDKYSECGGSGGYDAYILGAREKVEPSTKLILVEVQVYPEDTDTVEQIWGTFYVFF